MIEELPREATFHGCVTDPPYHLTSIVNRFGKDGAAPAKSDGQTGVFGRSSAGFMGQEWDGGDLAFRPETWRAVYDALHPGGHMVAFGGSRTFHRIACAIEDAGFEIRDVLFWFYGTGFPKSHSLEKNLIKKGFETEAATWAGWGTALKPAYEPILLVRKPLAESSVIAQTLATGTGGVNVDACRVGGGRRWVQGLNPRAGSASIGAFEGSNGYYTEQGRHPANILHDGSEEVAEVLGDAVQYFNAFPYSEEDYTRGHYSAKANKADRRGSDHPTVKPQALMRWLCRLVTPPGGHIVDPFAGSGATGWAAEAEGFEVTLIDKTPEYVDHINRVIWGEE